MSNIVRLILGSASPRRVELLRQIGINPDAVRPPDIDESPMRTESPHAYCQRMVHAKIHAIPVEDKHDIVLCADTIVTVGRRILGKPKNAEEATDFLHLLGGRRHQVITTLALKKGEKFWMRSVKSNVKMKRLSEQEIKAYIASQEWQNKAGGYGIQGLAASFISWISGSYSAIMGLPLAETTALLQAAGWPMWKTQ